MDNFRGLVLAGGRGSRFSDGKAYPKVLREACGKALIKYVLDALESGGVCDTTVVVGFMGDEIKKVLGGSVKYAFQREQKGSGDAVRCAKDAFCKYRGGIVIMCGDSPLFTAQTVRRMTHAHTESNAAITLGTAVLDNPFGYGRIKRIGDRVCAIVEEKCATAEEKTISEIGGGIYVFDSEWLFSSIDRMELNAAGEYNLTDMVRVAIEDGKTIGTVQIKPEELLGVNTPQELKKTEDILKER